MSWYSSFVTHTSDDLEDEEELDESHKKDKPKKEKEKKPKKEGLNGEKPTWTIKSRTKATTKFALKQVRDAVIAAGMVLAFHTAFIPLNIVGQITLGSALFIAKKGIDVGVHFGKKHKIKKREKSNDSIKRTAVEATIVAGGMAIPIIMLGLPPINVITIGTAAFGLYKLVGAGVKGIKNARKGEKTFKSKKERKTKEPKPIDEDDEYVDSATEEAEEEYEGGHSRHRS